MRVVGARELSAGCIEHFVCDRLHFFAKEQERSALLCCSQARPDVRVEVVWLDAKCLNGTLAVHAVQRGLIVEVVPWFFFHVWFSLIKIA